ncbi:uncharacterized protein MELLADRAFT_87247 [Melampsora larici-populina 98AG31]|uniref:Uncharacterized protein n=1 Tax=Melampsora larici-populina (strain 98AG31 / pathotype 3-4-7) TaxID=747676 RepID=F4SDQ8_MELLP|nr:uncharacterized protein MELLADRAFT_87247 [Melampsora larici-populina 98AG31]EGF97218.1 hypothetical protein MELLADRAFT_87247 [Melampsora larici-populina 98AG31]
MARNASIKAGGSGRKTRSSRSQQVESHRESQDDTNPNTNNPSNSQKISKKRKNDIVDDQQQDADYTITMLETSKTKSLEKVGIMVGAKTSRNRLLDLLSKHVTKKRPRISNDQQNQPAATVDTTTDNSIIVEQEEDSPEVEVDFSNFDIPDLVKMISGVGVDSRGMDKAELVQNCKIYRDLIIVPPKRTVDLNTFKKGVKFTFQSDPQASCQAGPSNSNTQELTARPTVHILPSLEHRRFVHPRPKPTILSTTPASSNNKGKERDMEEGDDDYEPDQEVGDDEESGDCIETSRVRKGSRRSSKEAGDHQEEGLGSSGMDRENTTKNNRERPSYDENRDYTRSDDPGHPSYNEMKRLWQITDEKVNRLTDEVKALTQVVDRHVNGTPEKRFQNKTRGGRISAYIRFHISVMLGQKSDTDPLPPPARPEDKDKWIYENDLDSVEINVQDLPLHDDEDAEDSNPDGPGHPDASPQQLAIIRKLMHSVGLESFRPDFSQSAQSLDNKWLWDISEKIFLKLAECGEYPGVPLDGEDKEFIKRYFSTHFQSLKKRYRKGQWEEDRQKAATDMNRRTTRLGRLKTARRKIVLANQRLWPLIPIVEAACSDDETDTESSSINSSPGETGSIIVRNISWRSGELAGVWKRLDSCQSRQKDSLTASNSSPRGRRSRPRLRMQNAPASRISVPKNLPTDCYSKDFLDSLTSKQKSPLDIDPTPVLPAILIALDTLGF